ncbi:SCO family protein [Candidatus Accumulibacter phosphatis]|uniref:SCO1/SenC n=3 Tax=Candidatus Accumulibacter TaxID=327159 RepID=A0A080M498_9PROT|nr:MAG: SCO1/SenC [Candidatus Accumulibacter cognatus]TMQ75251.1 Cytochrome oxidase biogenesis protein Sco1/SenC/PrrC, putative copper metallochaperone [Candidatus Accumulibacter phosphatis]
MSDNDQPASRLLATTMKILSTLILCITLLFSGCSQPPNFKSTDISGADWGKGFTLTDPQGQTRRLADFEGKVVIVFFGYTQCPDVCPTTLSSMREVLGRLGDNAGRVQVIFVTLDPARDTAQVLAEYARAFHPSFIGLRGDETAIAAVARDFKVFYARHAGSSPGSYSIDHSTGSYVFDPQGRLRLLVSHGETSANVAADLKLLLAGK